jgi:predicted pyridoxine 5'-phosphate oxidase superfamily flavin-nucleotide-binding protein
MPTRPVFHEGEIALQERDGTRMQTAAFSARAMRAFMPEQHREFFRTLPFMAAGIIDRQDRPWATMLSGTPGFIQSPTDTTLHIAAARPTAPLLAEGLRAGAPIGLLGIELPTRRRNRANGHIATCNAGSLTIAVQESFGNCPKYIQARDISQHGQPASAALENIAELNDEAKCLIESADTFFVASRSGEAEPRVDVSHRGGLPGFVRVDQTGNLHIPEFTGNRLFCTLGNFLCAPVAGLVFPNFGTGDLLHLSGTVELFWEGKEVNHYPGAVHGWAFHFRAGFWLRAALPFAASSPRHSPFLADTGPWHPA